MPGLKPGGMNGHSDYGRFGPDRGYTNGNFDQYSRDDPYRDEVRVEEEPLYRRPVRNGPRPANDRFNNDHLADQNSLSDFNSTEPAFELDHLATFASGSHKKDAMHVEDGLRKLRQMENTTGIWTMRCILLVERRALTILDKNSGEELERFPIQMIHEPTAVFKNDRREIYNNLVLFTVMDDSNRRESHSDMHIFQSVRTPAQNIVDEIFASKRGQGRVSSAGEAVLSEIFATHSFKIEGWEGQAVRQEIAQASGVGSASASHSTRYKEGLTSTNQSTLNKDEVASANQNAFYKEGSASTNQNALYREGSTSANQNAVYSRTTDYHARAGHQEGVGHAVQQNARHQAVTAPTANPNTAHTQYSHSEFGYTAEQHTSPYATPHAVTVPVIHQEIGEESQYRTGRYDPNTAPEGQTRTQIVTQRTTTTTTSTNQAQSNIEDGGVSTNEQRDDMPESGYAVVRHGYNKPPPAPSDPYDFGGFHETMEQRRFNQFSTSQTQYGASQFSNGGGFFGGAQRTSMMARPTYSPYREREDEFGSNELLERDVQLLNHCFDDIEKFVARLQQAAEAYKELERRRRERGAKGKKNVGGDGMLGHRARPPPAQDFVDIFQKFKLSFNLLAKLKAHIHDPNAPELVHFLFTPLSLIYEASRDPIHGSVNLGEQAVAPVLTQDAKQLLVNCLTSKEIELWQALGKNWTTSKEEWKGYIPPYMPRFYDGWQPAPTVMEEPATRATLERATLESAVAAHHNQILNRQHEQDVRDYVRDRVIPFPPEEERFVRGGGAPEMPRFERDLRAPTPPRDVMSNPSVLGYQQNYQANQRRVPEPVSQPPPPVSQPKQVPIDDNAAYLEELKRTGASVYEVLHDRPGKNSKELTVTKGDYLQVLDSSRNWWKVRNYKGQSGFCPYTILKEVTDQGGSASAEGGAKPSADHGSSKRDQRLEELATKFTGSPALVAQQENAAESSLSDQLDEMDLPSLIQEEEEEGERHAFRPVEPAHVANKGIKGIRPTQPQIDLHNELKYKMGQGQRQRGEDRRFGSDTQQATPPPSVTTSSPSGSTTGVQAFYITITSTNYDVATWLEAKGFSTVCRTTLQGFTGRDMFSLQRQEMEQLIGHDEAARLMGQLTLQKKMTGYKTQSAAELNAIFQKRRARSDLQGAALGHPPDFRPQTPSSYDGPDSDSDGDDRQLADTGKTLRDLLIRQRQKIIGSDVFSHQ